MSSTSALGGHAMKGGSNVNSDVFPAGEDVGAFVLDLGQLYIRGGYAGEDCPKQFAYAFTGRCVNEKLEASDSTEKNYAVGAMFENMPGVNGDIMSDSPNNNQVRHRSARRFPLSFTYPQDNIEVCPLLAQPSKRHLVDPMPSLDSVIAPVEPLEFDKEGFEGILGHLFGLSTGLGVELRGKPIIVSEPNAHNRPLRESIAEILFEKFEAEAVYTAKRAVLTAFAVGRSGGLVIDVGKEFTSLSPVQDGYVLQNHIQQFPVGGDLMDYQLGCFLKAAGLASITPLFTVKKRVRCDVNCSPFVESVSLISTRCHPSFYLHSQRETLRQMKEAIAHVAEDPIPLSHFSIFKENHPQLKSIVVQNPGFSLSSQGRYELPDGTTIQCDDINEKTAECLFNFECIYGLEENALPSVFHGCKSLPHAVAKCVLDCDVDVRRDLLSALILSGGTAITAGFSERMTRQLQDVEGLLGQGLKYKVVSPSSSLEKPILSWVGGSILASLGSFQQMWMSSAEYAEHGASLLERRCV